MAYRSGTYVAFHAGGTTDPTASDMKYYRMMEAWAANSSHDFSFVNSHDKTPAVRDTSSRETLLSRIRERLNNSKNMVLILTDMTKYDRDNVPFEIEYANDKCEIPIIAAYPDYDVVLQPAELSEYWPAVLASRIQVEFANVIHIPFAQKPLLCAIEQFTVHKDAGSGTLRYYTASAHRDWGLLHPRGPETNHLK